MFRSVSDDRVVYEAIPVASWVLCAILMVLGLTCASAAPRRIQPMGHRTAIIGLAALLLRRRVAFDRRTREVRVHWALSLAPALPALHLRLISVAPISLFNGVCVGSCAYEVYNHQTRRRETVEEHAVRLVRDGGPQITGMPGDGALIHRFVRLGGAARAATFGRQVADDLGLPFRDDLG